MSFGIKIEVAPVPAKLLELKSNDLDVTLDAEYSCVGDDKLTLVLLIVASPTLGLKSTVSLRSNSPDGVLTSGSTLVAVYVGISL